VILYNVKMNNNNNNRRRITTSYLKRKIVREPKGPLTTIHRDAVSFWVRFQTRQSARSIRDYLCYSAQHTVIGDIARYFRNIRLTTFAAVLDRRESALMRYLEDHEDHPLLRRCIEIEDLSYEVGFTIRIFRDPRAWTCYPRIRFHSDISHIDGR